MDGSFFARNACPSIILPEYELGFFFFFLSLFFLKNSPILYLEVFLLISFSGSELV